MIPLGNHLWQSTLFLASAAALTFAFRRHRAQVRYGIWLAACLKFLIPFAALVAIGNQLSWREPALPGDTTVAAVIDLVSQPFSQPGVSAVVTTEDRAARTIAAALPYLLLAIWVIGAAAMCFVWAMRWRRIAALVHASNIVEQGRVHDILRRLEGSRADRPRRTRPLTLVSSDGALEPGVFGIFRPVLLWPESITRRLTDDQIEAILLHELAHVRRSDNLAATVQMIVQAAFWFHPLVWWLGARLVEERERACDEDVVRQGSAPHVYAESILKTCEFHVESPLTCVAGVTGADLKERIEQIMRGEAAFALGPWRKTLLAAVAVVAFAGPVVLGALNAPRLQAQSVLAGAGPATFEVVSIKPNRSGNGPSGSRSLPSGQYAANNVTLRMLISNAFGAPLQPLLPGLLVGGPEWIDSERFDILAKAESGLPQGPNSPVPQMIRNMLADRFKLAVHNETRQMPIFALVIARRDGRTGPRLISSAVDCSAGRGRGAPPVPIQPGERPPCGLRLLRGNISAGGVTMAQFANLLTRLAGRVVVDMTTLTGGFDLDLQWTPDQPAPAGLPDPRVPQPPIDPDGPSLFTAIQEQLGLRLEAQQGQIEVLVVDQAERPTVDDFESLVLPAPPAPPPPPPPGL